MFDPLTAELEELAATSPSAVTLARLEQLRAEPLTSAQRMLVARAWDRAACYVQAGFVTAQVDATTPPSTLPAGGGCRWSCWRPSSG